MNLKRIVAVITKERREIVRDRLFLALAFVVPLSLMFLFGYGLSLDVEHIPFAVVDYDNTALSRDYLYRFTSSRYFDFRGVSRDQRLLDRLLATNSIRAYLVIPEHFERDLMAGQAAHVQTLIDGTFPFRAKTTKGYVIAINSAFSAEMLAGYLNRTRGLPQEQALVLLQPVHLEVRNLYNQSMVSIWSIAPNLVMLILMVSPPFLTVLGVVREKERGSIYNIYASTVTRGEFLLGKITPYVMISVINAMVLWGVAVFWFGAPFKGNVLFFLGASLVYVACTTGIGLTVSVLVNTQVAAMIVSTVVTLVPAVLYSGFLVPLSSLSDQAQIIAHLLPAMYYANIVTGTFLKGVGLSVLWPNVLVLAIYAAVLFAIGFFAFSKRPSA